LASEKNVYIWDLISLTQVGSFKAHNDEIKALCMSPDNNHIFTGGKGTANAGGLMIWDVRKLQHVGNG
jgi:WD40 repeat protein